MLLRSSLASQPLCPCLPEAAWQMTQKLLEQLLEQVQKTVLVSPGSPCQLVGQPADKLHDFAVEDEGHRKRGEITLTS